MKLNVFQHMTLVIIAVMFFENIAHARADEKKFVREAVDLSSIKNTPGIFRDKDLFIKPPHDRKTGDEYESLDLKNYKEEDFSSLQENDGNIVGKDMESNVFKTTAEESWIGEYSSGIISSADYARSIAVDKYGNVYVTGNCEKLISDIITIKYNSQGIQQWINKYDGPSRSVDQATTIKVDLEGNVYVAGYSFDSATNYDYVILKYNSEGKQLWVTRYNVNDYSDDRLTTMAIDIMGNVYVTGYTYDPATNYDYVTVKYNKDGQKQWVERYNSPDSLNDKPVSIAIDIMGNVYVLGNNCVSEYLYEFTELYATIIKYNSNGHKLWVDTDNELRASSMAIDYLGNAYVAGYKYYSETDYDFVAIKYNSNGLRNWFAKYNTPVMYSNDFAYAIAVDINGNVYVTGHISTFDDQDYLTVKFNSDGQYQWAARYNGTGNINDNAISILLDSVSNIYITGNSYGPEVSYDYATIKYNSDGQEQWVARYNGTGNNRDIVTAMEIDSGGNVYVTGYSYDSFTSYDYTTIKYNANGEEEWVARYDGPKLTNSYATAMAIDSSKNIYVTGYCANIETGYDYVTIKYNASGEEQWAVKYNNPENGDDIATAIAVDAKGNVYVTGRSYYSASGFDFITIKYDANGQQLWAVQYNSGEKINDEPYRIKVDTIGNVYVTGSGIYGYNTIKYDSSGKQLWLAINNDNEGVWGVPVAIEVDASGNVYVTGSKYVTIKYNKEGIQQWNIRYTRPDYNYINNARALAVDESGNVYVTGETHNGLNYEFTTIKYSSSGQQLWVVSYNSSFNSNDNNDIPAAIVVDKKGYVYVTGYCNSSGTNCDFVTIKYSSSGSKCWITQYNGTGNSHDYARALKVDDNGNVFVTGYSMGKGTFNDYVTIKYNSAGRMKEIARYNGNANRDDIPVALEIDTDGNIYVTGSSISSDTSRVVTTIKYTKLETSVNKINATNDNITLFQNYPNPFNQNTKITYIVNSPCNLSLKIYDFLGREIATLANGMHSPGEYTVEWNGPTLTEYQVTNGVYFYQLITSDGFRVTKKMLLLK